MPQRGALRRDEPELPARAGAATGGAAGAVRVRPPGRLAVEEARARTGRWRTPARRCPPRSARRPAARGAVGGQRLGGAQHQRRGTVGQHHERRSSARARPGPARRPAGARAAPCPVLPTLAARSSATASAGTPARRTVRLTARVVQPGHDQVIHLAGGEPGLLQRRRRTPPRPAARTPARRSAPPRPARPARRASASGPGTRRWPSACADDLGQHRQVASPSPPKTKAAAPSPPSRSSALPGSPVRMSESTTRVGHRATGPPATQRAHARADRAGHVDRQRVGGSAAARRAPRWRWSCRVGGMAVANSRPAAPRPVPPRSARGARLRPPSTWCPRRRTRPPRAPAAALPRTARSRRARAGGTGRRRRRQSDRP